MATKRTLDSKAMIDVWQERQQQIKKRGYTAGMDDRWVCEELVFASAAYSLNGTKFEHPMFWPFRLAHFHPRTKRENLVRAAALLVAEIERLDRMGEPIDERTV